MSRFSNTILSLSAAGTAAFAAAGSIATAGLSPPPAALSPSFLPHATNASAATAIHLFMISSGALAAMNAEGAQFLVQVRTLDPERLRSARDVPVELGQPDADELALDLLAELAQALARIAAEVDRGVRSAAGAR